MSATRTTSPTGRPANLDTGLCAVAIIGKYYGCTVDPAVLAHELALSGRRSAATDLVRAFRQLGLKARLVAAMDLSDVGTVPKPAIAKLKDGRFFVLGKTSDDSILLVDPLDPRPRSATPDEFDGIWDGELVLVTRRDSIRAMTARFEFKWFAAAVWRYRVPLSHVLIASFILQVFALATPLLFQVVIDKVLVHKSLSTLEVVFCGLLMVGLFDALLQYLRSYALFHTANRVDVELGSHLFNRLMRLNLSYFETRPAGQTVARVRELETIRSFLTSQALTSVIDLGFTLLFAAILFLYSVTLTLIVIAAIPIYVAVAAFVRPILRERIQERFNRGAASQQFLVESIVGAPTLKSAAVEPIMQTQWEDKLSSYVRSSFEAVMLGSAGQSFIQFISKSVTALILLFGAQAVIAGQLTVGELVAFNMIAAQFTAPVLRLSQLWQDFQQVQISIERVGDILNAPVEQHADGIGHVPALELQGQITFQNITFRYHPAGPPILNRLSLDVPVGQVLGIIGRSGSGKSTLTKLIQRLYLPERGRIMIDGIDIADVHPAWVRRRIGVVLQENLLFNRTILENILLAAPSVSRDHAVELAKLAGAHEFIAQLPNGYDSMIVERGANLSGGQRQRIAIARALATDPRILILDEATSALDYESECIIQANMKKIVRGRTVIIVAHRLAAVRDCDRIIALDQGEIVEEGTHEHLLRRQNGLYAHLWSLQGAVAT